MMKNHKKVLITGANGLLGQNLARVLKDYYNLILTDMHKISYVQLTEPFIYIPADISDITSLKLIEALRPDVVFHFASITDVDGCEENPQAAHKVNVEGTKNLISLLPKSARVVFMSTDYVFDGTKGPYSEDDSPNPIGVYGQTKLDAENIIKQEINDSIILRTTVLYGNGIGLRPFFPDWVLKRLLTDEKIKVVDDQVSNTTLASNLANICKAVMENAEPGTYNASGSEIINRFELAKKIAENFGFNVEKIVPCKTKEIKQKAKRPLNSGFILEKIKKVHDVNLINVNQQLELYKKERNNG